VSSGQCHSASLSPDSSSVLDYLGALQLPRGLWGAGGSSPG